MTDQHGEAPQNLDSLMEQERRRLLQARMLPDEGPLTALQREEVIVDLRAYMAQHGISQHEVGRQSGVAHATVNLLLQGRCTGSDQAKDKHVRALNNWMEVDARQQANRPAGKFVEIRVARRVFACAQKAKDMPTMAVAHGPSGIGKTLTAHALKDKYPGTVYLSVTKGETSFTAVRRNLAARVLTSRKKRAVRTLAMNEQIFEVLKGTNRLIIIDEAHRLDDGALEFLRDVFDHTQCPMLFLCTVDLVDRIRRDNDEDHGQIYRRFGYVRDLAASADREDGGRGVEKLFSVAEIREIFEEPKVKLHPDAQAYLLHRANMLGHGSLGLCANLMKIAVPIERAHRKVGPDATVTITAALLQKIDRDYKHDRRMRSDMDAQPIAATA